MWTVVTAGPLALLGIEFGWIFACTGRQPWVIYRMMTTAEAVTQSTNLGTLFLLFTSIYVFLLVAVVLVLRSYFRRHPIEQHLSTHM